MIFKTIFPCRNEILNQNKAIKFHLNVNIFQYEIFETDPQLSMESKFLLFQVAEKDTKTNLAVLSLFPFTHL